MIMGVVAQPDPGRYDVVENIIFQDNKSAILLEKNGKTSSGKRTVKMLDYIEEVIKTFDKMDQKATGTKTSAAPSNQFVVKEDCTKLTKEKSEQFHSVVAKMLFATKRAVELLTLFLGEFSTIFLHHKLI